MSTSVSEIYNLFLFLIEDENLALIGETLARKQMYHYLLNSTTRFSSCKKDLSIINNTFGDFIINQGLSEYIITDIKSRPVVLDETETLIEGIDYNVEYSQEENKATITLLKEFDNNIIFNYFIDGNFVEDLTLLEKRILALGMVLEWITPKLNREDNLKQRVTNKEFKKLSNANLLDKLIKLEKYRREEYRNLITEYSYIGFTGFN